MSTYYPLITVCAVLLLFGVFYNELVAYMEDKKVEGYTWHQVAGGVAVTLLAASVLIGWQAALTVALCMAFSGAPMAGGAWLRHRAMVRAAAARLKAEAETAGSDGKQA